MRVAFLDVDGVLNSAQSASMYFHSGQESYENFCPIASSNLRVLLEKVPDLMIVVSSTWRIGLDLEQLKTLFHAKAGVSEDRVIGATPVHLDNVRGLEIKEWLSEHPEVSDYVIIDDESDMGPCQEHLVHTSFAHGFMWKDMLTVLSKLGVMGWQNEHHR